MKTKSYGMEIAPRITLKGESGAKVDVDLSDIVATDAQKQTLKKLFETGQLESLSVAERNSIKDLKALVNAGPGPQAFIVRFDWTWVRID